MSGAILKPIKMSKAIWVYIGSTGIPHPGTGGISQGLYASDKRHRPTVGNISQGLHVSNVPCAHRASDDGQWQVASAKACKHLANNIGQWQVALAKACMLRMWHVRIGQAMSANDM